MSSWHTIRLYAKRLETQSRRIKDAIWTGNERQLLNTLADCAEAGEISRRLYNQLQGYLQVSVPDTSPGQPHCPLQDEPRT
jgi:hypothetical protein